MLGFRDPRQVIKGRIDAKITNANASAEAAARGAIVNTARGAVKAAVPAAKGAAQPQKKKAKMGWWPFGGKEKAAEAATCPSCSKEIDPSWQACPYCRAPLGAAAPAPAPQGAPAGQPRMTVQPPSGAPMMPMMDGNKTMAIDINQLAAPRKSVVGWLVVMNGNQKGFDFRLYEGRNVIGAAADNDIVITDEYLSSKHATIRYEDGKYEFIDNDSTNGSFLNEKRVSKEELIDNDTVRLGRTEFRFKALY